MSTTFSIPDDYHYVVAALSSIPLVLWGQFFTVEVYRRKARIAYPQLYADKAQVDASRDAYIFNCAQRAHQNTLETIPVILLSTTISGLQYPLVAAGFCAFWSITRIPFTLGYVSGDPSKRAQGGAKFALWGSIILSVISAFAAGKRLLEYRSLGVPG